MIVLVCASTHLLTEKCCINCSCSTVDIIYFAFRSNDTAMFNFTIGILLFKIMKQLCSSSLIGRINLSDFFKPVIYVFLCFHCTTTASFCQYFKLLFLLQFLCLRLCQYNSVTGSGILLRHFPFPLAPHILPSFFVGHDAGISLLSIFSQNKAPGSQRQSKDRRRKSGTVMIQDTDTACIPQPLAFSAT